MNSEMFKLELEKAEEPEEPNCQHPLEHRKSNRIPEKHLFLLYWVCQNWSMQLLFSDKVVSDSVWPCELQYTRLHCPSLSPRACLDSCPLNQWCHPTIWASEKKFSMVVWTYFGIAFLWDWNENWPFPVLWPLLSVPNLLTCCMQHFNSIVF